MRRAPLLLLTFVAACNPAASPNPTPAPDTSLCAPMCAHIGTGDGGLGCAEGDPLYDSTQPGPVGVPNETCTQFCVHQQNNGVFINPRCVMQVTSCAQIEAARQKTCQ